MSPLTAIANGTPPETGHQPWPRFVLDETAWTRATEALGDGHCVLLGYWAEPGRVHLALADALLSTIGVFSLACDEEGSYPSVAARFPPAARLERTIRDLYGLHARNTPDPRPWLDHGAWPQAADAAAPPPADRATAYPFLTVEGEGVHQIPVGPVHAGIIEPGHFRFTAQGETVVRLEERLGYVHKGIERLMAGAPLAKATRLAARVSGDSTVAYGIAFARALEAATSTTLPQRAHWLRALMAELERVANHLGDFGAICNDAAFAFMLAECGALREQVLRAVHACFGHRLMMDLVVPGGVARDLTPDGNFRLQKLVAALRSRLPTLVEIYDGTTSLQDRTVGTGILRPDLAQRFACGGYVGRASGRAIDARKQPGYPPYPGLSFKVPVLEEGDVNARIWIRIREVEQSLSLIEQVLQHAPDGPLAAPLRVPEGASPQEGIALVEGFRGDILAWVRLNPDGSVGHAHLRDPSWFQWPLLEAAIEGNIVADFPLCNKSFNCSYSGHDL